MRPKKFPTALTATDQESDRTFRKARALAVQFGLCSKTIHRMSNAGHFRRYKVAPRVVLYDAGEVKAFIESGRLNG